MSDQDQQNFAFQWHLTNRCNLRCRHCYQADRDENNELPDSILMQLADKLMAGLHKSQVCINLTGGEPLLLPTFFRLVDHLSEFSCLQQIDVITNGTICHEQLLRNIKTREKIQHIKVSLESSDPQTHDSIRGQGNFDLLMHNLPRFVALGKPVILMATLGRYNVAGTKKMIRFARELGVSGVLFERFVPLGRGMQLRSQVLKSDDWRRVVACIGEETGITIGLREMLSYRAFWLTFGAVDNTLRAATCNLGESMALMPDATVFPCRRLPISIGNALTDSTEQLRKKLSEYHPRSIVSGLEGNCGRCVLSDCIGCRALAFACHHDLFADDPVCILNSATAQ